MTNKPSNLITVGCITGVFGIKGWVKVRSWTEPAEQIVNYAPWWLKTHHGAKAVEIDEHRFRPQGLVVRIKGFESRDQAEDLGRVDIAVERQQLPELAEGEYYWYQLCDMRVISRFDGCEYEFGRVEKLLQTGANDVLVVQPGEGSMDDRERLIPWVPQMYVKNVDLEAGTIVVEWDPDF